MGRLLGCARGRVAVYLFALVLLSANFASSALGQDEVIVDPELSGSDSAPQPATEGDEIIVDPELSGSAAADPNRFGWGAVYDAPAGEGGNATPDEDDYDPLANTGMAKLELASQVGIDLRQEGDLEDAFETRLRFGGEVELRRSRRLRLVIGSRVDFLWAAPGPNDGVLVRLDQRALDQDRFEVDLIPTAAFADMSLFDGFHLRVGQQVVSLGRMDFYSPSDMLVVYDTRPQPKLDPAAAKMAQPAVRIDWDLGTAFTLQAAYIPWFSPHLTRPNRDQYIATVTSGPGSALSTERLSGLIDPSWQPKSSEANVRFVSPAPDFSTPQAQARLVFRAPGFDMAVSGGTALEKLPAVYLTPALESLQINPLNPGDAAVSAIAAALSRNEPLPLFDAQYHRYAQVGADLGFELGSIAIGFEAAYSPSRHMYTATKDGLHLPQPNVKRPITDNVVVDGAEVDVTESNVTDESIRAGVPVVQGAMHVEWVKGETWVVGGEVFGINALELPYDRTRDWWGFIPGTGAFVGGTVGASCSLDDGRWRLEVTSILSVGPSVAVVPHIELRAREGVFIDVGAQIYEGPTVGYPGTEMVGGQNVSVMRVVGAQNVNMGGLLSGYDQVFVGLRWLP
jgi:hypothetical protein